MKGINKVILVGNLGKDPESNKLPSGDSVANITIATSEAWKDKHSGQNQERTEWHRVVFFGRLADIVGEFLRKGSKVYVEGSLRTRKWQDNKGTDRYTTEIVAREMQMLDSRSDNQNNGGDQHDQSPQNHQQNQRQPTQQPKQHQQDNQQQGQNQPNQNYTQGAHQGNYQQNRQSNQQQPNQQQAGQGNSTNFSNFDDDIPF